MAIYFVRLLLSLDGDVESNRGFWVTELLSEILSNQKQIAEDIFNNVSDIKTAQRYTDSVTEYLSQWLGQINEKVKTLGYWVGAIGNFQTTVGVCTKKITVMQPNLVDFVNNLIIHRFAESAGETGESLFGEVIEGMFVKTLGVRVSRT